MAGRDEHQALTAEERRRYRRHLVLPEVGEAGQLRLKRSRVLLVGAGGLGSPVALYLAAAGVGHLTIVDFDQVEVSNLQRQVLHGSAGVGRPKVESARDRLRDLNPHVVVEPIAARFDRSNALELVAGHDLVVDGTDNFSTRYLINDACVMAGRPYVYGAVFRFEGQAAVLAAPGGPCYRCLHPAPPSPELAPSCAVAGVLGVLPGLVGLVQASEALKLLAGVGEPLLGRLLLVDALAMEFETVVLARDPTCPACGTRTLQGLGLDFEADAGEAEVDRLLAEDDDGQEVPTLTPRQLAERLASGAPPDLLDVREPHEWAQAPLPGVRRLPLSQFTPLLAQFDRERDLVICCMVGVRSAAAVRRLRAAGHARVWNLSGGLIRWSAEVEQPLATG